MCGRWALALRPSQLRERLEQDGLRVDRWIQDPIERVDNSEGSANDASSNNTSMTRNTEPTTDSTMNTDINAMADTTMDAMENYLAVDTSPTRITMADEDTTVDAGEKDPTKDKMANTTTQTMEKDITNKDTVTSSVRPSYNIAPTYIEPIYRARLSSSSSPVSQHFATSPTSSSPPDDITYELVPARWGVIPSWTTSGEGDGEEGLAITLKTINCRAEKLGEDRGLWAGLRGNGRCVVPAMGWFEWRARGGVKTPYFLRPINDDGLFYFAGLYNTININKSTINTFTIITTPSSPQLRFLHTRMPAVLRTPEEVRQWLNPTLTQWGNELQALLRPHDEEVVVYRVGREVGKVGVEGEGLVRRVEEGVERWIRGMVKGCAGESKEGKLKQEEDRDCAMKEGGKLGLKEEEAEMAELEEGEGEEIRQRAETPPPPREEDKNFRATMQTASEGPKRKRNINSPRTTPRKKKKLDGKGDMKITSFFKKKN